MFAIEFNNVWKKFKKGEKFNSLRDTIPNLFRKKKGSTSELDEREFWVTKDVDFKVEKGEVVGIIGPNGAGKSTILKLLSGIIVPNKGTMNINGRLSALIEVTAGFHPELTGRENAYLNGTILGMKKKEIDEKYDQIVEFSGLSEFMDTPVKRYSSGMFSRLGFSVAAHVDPDVLLVDEVLSVGDIAFQSKCTQKMRELLNSGTTIVIVSHNLQLVQSLCKRVILLDKGEIIKEGKPEDVIPYYEDIVFHQQEDDFKKSIKKNNYKVNVKDQDLVDITGVEFNTNNTLGKIEYSLRAPISFKINYESKEEIGDPLFNLEIIRADGVKCFTSNTKDTNIPRINGKGSINVDMSGTDLAPGIYLVKLSVWDKDMLHPYTIRRSDFFKVSASGDGERNEGVFLPNVEWMPADISQKIKI